MLGVPREQCVKHDCLHPCFGSGFINDQRAEPVPHPLGANCFKCFAMASADMQPLSGNKENERRLLFDYYCDTCKVPAEDFSYCGPDGACNSPFWEIEQRSSPKPVRPVSLILTSHVTAGLFVPVGDNCFSKLAANFNMSNSLFPYLPY